MAKPWYSTKTATTVSDDGDGWMACVYHQTKVVRWDRDTRGVAVLNSGGHRTATTKARMNEVSKHYDLGFHVFQTGGNWFVTDHNGHTVPYVDGVEVFVPYAS
ncbi:hypothetical protein C4565_08295 [Candidatus Parcubacteria bacterium]|nr:MAG: hypothetical protein C4565_08295 [Candidatus Parcubacteria bacterium]